MNYLSELLSYIPCFGLICIFTAIFLSYRNFSLPYYLFLLALYLIKFNLSVVFWVLYLTASLFFIIPRIRTAVITSRVVGLIKKLGLLPKISETEKIALTSGTVWVDGELFSGNPNFKTIFNQQYPSLSVEEQNFIDNQVEEVCKMCSDYRVQQLKDLPPEVWQYLKDNKFFGMIIPKEFGGLGFSAFGHSSVIQKLSSRSAPLAITAMVPNSLGPAELLMQYGTEEQKNYYLPRLADGRELPCFAVTETMAGSDATSISSNGVLFRDNDGEIKIRLNWSKRYITLGAYATIIGLAFQLKDPEKLIGENIDIGITCALIPNNLEGVKQGRRHDPLATPFVNSPINGENVIIDLSRVIGGKSNLGKGWKMIMECLSVGRGISLPSTSAGASKLVARVVANYSILRKQFGTSIGKFEGIEEVSSKIISRNYILEALRSFTAGAVDIGAKPAVISAIAKYHATELFRKNINDGMDILGGRAIIRGSRNLLANAYLSTPISITVEGANIMTRSLIQFGQGAIMSHPFAYREIIALEQNNLVDFDKVFFAHIGHLFSNLSRSIVLSITRGRSHRPLFKDKIGKYEQKIAWCSATFAFLVDIALAKFGGNLKRKEKLNGRFGDALSAMYLAVAVLKKYDYDGRNIQEQDVVEMALKELMSSAQIAIEGIYENLFSGVYKKIFFIFSLWSRVNQFSCPIDDNLTHRVAKKLIADDDYLRNKIGEGIFVSKDKNDNLGRLENCLELYRKSKDARSKIELAIKNQDLPNQQRDTLNYIKLLELAVAKNIISFAEKSLLEEYFNADIDAMEVDEYTIEEYNKN